MRRWLDHQVPDYQVARSNAAWSDHVARTVVTGALIAWTMPKTVLDPACGDGSIVEVAHKLWPIAYANFADISEPNIRLLNVSMPNTADVMDIDRALLTYDPVDTVVMTEILEHLPDPDKTLRNAWRAGSTLVVSSPEMRNGQVDSNPEHLWMFDGDGYRQMLVDNGWLPFHKTHLAFPEWEYDFQIWVARQMGGAT